MPNPETIEAPALVPEPPKTDSVLSASVPTTPSYAWVTQTFVLAGCSALSYLYAYLYEAGFCAHFGIPSELIKIDTVRLIITLICVYGTIQTIYCASDCALILFSPTKIPKKAKIILAVLMLSLIVGLIIQAPTSGFIYLALVPFASLIYCEVFHKVGMYEILDRINPVTFSDLVSLKVGGWTLKASYYLTYLGIVIFAFGYSNAIEMHNFLVLEGSPQKVILAIYGDTLICAKANLPKHQIFCVFSLYPITSDAAKSLTLHHLSKMKVMDDWKRK